MQLNQIEDVVNKDIKKLNILNIVLSQKISALQEVVINKGYYTEKQRYSVGNVGQVTAKDIEKQPV